MIRYSHVDIHRAARKHRVADADIVHAIRHAVAGFGLEERDDEPRRTLVLGADRAGNFLEVVVLELDDGGGLVIHAMSMRASYARLLPRP